MSQREDFEEAAARMGYNLTMRDVDYEDDEYLFATQRAWDMWQECCQLKSDHARDGQSVGEVGPMVYGSWNNNGGNFKNVALVDRSLPLGTKLYTQPQSVAPASCRFKTLPSGDAVGGIVCVTCGRCFEKDPVCPMNNPTHQAEPTP